MLPRILGVVLTLSGVVSLSAAPAWLKLETREVIIYSDASPKDVVDFAVGYTAYRQVFRELFAPPVRLPPATFLLFRSYSDFEKVIPTSPSMRTLNYTCEIDGAVLTALAVDGDRKKALRQTYEFDTIWSLQRAGLLVPLWMSQGSGEVIESMELRDGVVEIGPSTNYSWPSGALEWNTFFSIATYSDEYRKPGTPFHGQAWALMHRVLLGGGVPAENFKSLAAKLSAEEPEKVVQGVLGVEPSKFAAEIRRHLRANKRIRVSTPAESLRKSLVPVPAPAVEVHLQRSNLLFATGKNNEGELELARAQGLALSGSPLIKEARARQAVRERRAGDAVALYREAIELGSTNPAVFLRAAELLLNEVAGGNRMSPGAGGLAAQQAADMLRHVLAADPGNPYAYHQLGRAFYLLPELRAEHVDELSVGVTDSPAGMAVRYYRALLCQRLDRQPEMIADLTAVIEDRLSDPSLRKIANEVVFDSVVKPLAAETEKLVAEKRFADARAKLAAISLDKASTALRNQVGRLTQWVAENEAWDEVKTIRAEGDTAKTNAAAKAFLERFPDSNAATQARAWIIPIDG